MSLFVCGFLDLDHRRVLSLDPFGVLLGLLLILDEGSQGSNFVVLVFLKVEAVLLSEAHLQQVIVERLL
jgi:hypothetical protein